jgi:hypothetical protein
MKICFSVRGRGDFTIDTLVPEAGDKELNVLFHILCMFMYKLFCSVAYWPPVLFINYILSN